jgi:CHAD domain-containing protein
MGKNRTLAKQQDTSPGSSNTTKTPRRSRAGAGGTSSASPAEAPANPAEHLLKVADEFNKVLDQCLDDPEVETVHRVRTGSRRVQAMIESICRQMGSSPNPLEVPGKKWLRQVKALRRAAGPVRDMDVQRKLLEENLRLSGQSQKGKDASGAVEVSTSAVNNSANESYVGLSELAGQARRLDGWLKGQRDAQAQALDKQIKKRRQTLSARQRDFLHAMDQVHSRTRKAPRDAALLALEDFVRVVDAMPNLDAANLHDFRKKTKKARYVAESGGKGENAQTIAKALKRVQDAIGDWHDWQCLTEEAEAVLKQDGSGLTAWLKRHAEHSLQDSLNITKRMSGRLVGEWMSGKQRPAAGNFRRRPPRAAVPHSSVQRQGLASGVA